MTALEIELLRANYHDVDLARLSALDQALAELTAHGLDDELVRLDIDGGLLSDSRAFAICVAELTVDIEVDDGSPPRETAAKWAKAILDALCCDVGSGSPGDRLVIYESVSDALVDVVTSTSIGDRRRLWAWHQVGVVPRHVPHPTAGDVADACADRPESIIAVLSTAGAACRSLFGPREWRQLAQAVGSMVGDRRNGADAVSDTTSGAASTLEPTLGRSIAAVIPASVWSAADGTVETNALAVLALAVSRPHLARDAAAVRAVAEIATQADAPVPYERTAAVEHDDSADAPTDRATEADHESNGGESVDSESSEWGGVLFLVHAFRALDVVGRVRDGPLGAADPLDALTAIVVALTGCPSDDLAVRYLVGRKPNDPTNAWDAVPRTRGAEQRAAVEAWAATVTTWLVERAGGRLAARLSTSSGVEESIWRRTVSISSSPGWIEVTSPLADVDLDVRVAGLDIDPGFVWWLGAVVRFRYV